MIYTDGTATHETRMGDAVVITEGEPENPHEIITIERKEALYTCSYKEDVEQGPNLGRKCYRTAGPMPENFYQSS